MTFNSNIENTINSKAKKILKDGELLKTTEALTLRASNNYDFARRIMQDIALIFAGQTIRYLNIGQMDRAYSHLGLYAPPGSGKDYAWKLARYSNIFPTDVFRLEKIENVTEAALAGTINENTIVPPPAVTEDVIFVGEYATLARGNTAANIAADLRAILESGEYSRRMAKIGLIKETLRTKPNSPLTEFIQEQLEHYQKIGMTIDLERCEISIKSSASWIVASAKFGSETSYGHSLLSMGDITRYRWISYLPSRMERIRTTSEIGSLPPVTVSIEDKKTCEEAWRTLITGLRVNAVEVVRDEQSYYERKRVWDEIQKVLLDTYQDELANEIYFNQVVNMRLRAELTRLMYQHAVLKQYARDQGHDFNRPEKFIIDHKEDGDFAKQLWINEYVPSMIDVIRDVLRHYDGGVKSARETLSSKGETIVIERLKDGPAKRGELLELLKKANISSYTLDNQILPKLMALGTIVRDSFGWYSLPSTSGKDQTTLDTANQKQTE